MVSVKTIGIKLDTKELIGNLKYGVDSMEWLYEKNKDNTSRFVLGVKGDNPLVCIGINPSTAVPERLDSTLKSVERVAESNGYDGWIMLNVYPQRATDPNNLHERRDFSLTRVNLENMGKIFEAYQPDIWAAWGTIITRKNYLLNCLYPIVDLSKDYNCRWFSAGVISKEGHPHHPLYLKKEVKLNLFDVDGYVKKASTDRVFRYIKDLKRGLIDSESDFLETLYRADLMDRDYASNLTTSPIHIGDEMEKLDDADFVVTRAILTAMLREDHFTNGSLITRIENGDLLRVLEKLKKF